MALKVYKPITAGTRGRVDLVRDELTTDRPEKTLVSGKKSTGGRGQGGRISVAAVTRDAIVRLISSVTSMESREL